MTAFNVHNGHLETCALLYSQYDRSDGRLDVFSAQSKKSSLFYKLSYFSTFHKNPTAAVLRLDAATMWIAVRYACRQDDHRMLDAIKVTMHSMLLVA